MTTQRALRTRLDGLDTEFPPMATLLVLQLDGGPGFRGYCIQPGLFHL